MRLSEGLVNSEMSWNHPEELTEQVGSRIDFDQQVQMTEGGDQDDILMIGGIELFLPCAQEEAESCVAGEATAEEQSQLEMTVRKERKLEQECEIAQAQTKVDEKEDEHSEGWLITFSQEDEITVALELTVEGAKKDGEHSEEWLDIFSHKDEQNATEEVVEVEEEEIENICFVDLWD